MFLASSKVVEQLLRESMHEDQECLYSVGFDFSGCVRRLGRVHRAE